MARFSTSPKTFFHSLLTKEKHSNYNLLQKHYIRVFNIVWELARFSTSPKTFFHSLLTKEKHSNYNLLQKHYIRVFNIVLIYLLFVHPYLPHQYHPRRSLSYIDLGNISFVVSRHAHAQLSHCRE